MSREKQIKEIAKIIARRSTAFRNPNVAFMTTAEKTATDLYDKNNYRKQIEGYWITPTVIDGRAFNVPHCSVCEGIPCGVDENTKYCPNCGAKMKGGAE